ncbi:MAG: hypothetical protein MUO26_07840 [Methanotrichaceae archaeon]|nr:hypothetical protein [Methanotrichaceae archaeon]
MRYGLIVPNFGSYHQPKDMAKLALHAEESGWDGFFLWDHIMARSISIWDPWIALAQLL